jgi:hypothetical protein
LIEHTLVVETMTKAPTPPASDSSSVSPVRSKYPRRNRKDAPKEHISPAAAATKRSDTSAATNSNNKTATAAAINADTPLRKSGVIEDLRCVLLVSGSSWFNGKDANNKNGEAVTAAAGTAAPPSPPSNPPPRPTELLSLLMVGPDEVGKMALMEQFVHDPKNLNKTDSTSSSPQKSKAAPEGWSFEYRKKDWAYHRSGSTAAAAAAAESSVQCVRLLLWNATVNNRKINTGSNTVTLPPDASLAWPAALKTHSQHMILVVSMADSKSLVELQKTVRSWKRYLDHATGRKRTSSGTSNTMQLILTVPAASSMQKHAAYYLRVGAAMQRLATELSILAPSWAVLDAQHNESVTTTSTSLNEIHATWMNITEQVLSSNQKQQRQESLATASTATGNGNDQQYAVATAAAMSTPASRGSNKASSSLDNGSNSPGTIVLDAQDVITISPDKDDNLTR